MIELLVVIAVVALLMAILLPCLQRARRQGKAIVCQSRLKQWGHILAMYTDENEGYFPYGSTVAPIWLFRGPMPLQEGDSTVRPLTQRVPTDGIRCCPTAVRVREPIVGGIGTIEYTYGPSAEMSMVTYAVATTRWETWKAICPAPAFVASYGFNAWLFRKTSPLQGVRQIPRGANVFSAQGGPGVPVLLDAMLPDAFAGSGDRPPDEEEYPRTANNMLSFCRNRHDGYVNGLFLDWSVRKVGLKELWTLKWDKSFNTRGRWTRAGNFQPEDWPEWMRNFKDY